jgi:hypothetical protein
MGYFSPIATEALSVPLDNSFWLDDDKPIGPTLPSASESNPESPVSVVEQRARFVPLKRHDLLA